MSPTAFANLFELNISPQPQWFYRGPRIEINENDSLSSLVSGRYVYSLFPSNFCKERVTATREILKNIVRQNIAAAIEECDKFFDVSGFHLSGSISGNLLHKEEVFSIARSFQLQIVFDQKSLYLTVLPNLRVYNRLRLPEVLSLLGGNSLSLPQRALCFAGKGAEARWRDGQILDVGPENCIAKIPSIEPSEITIPISRVIPRLRPPEIKRLLHLKGSHTRVEKKLKDLRKGPEGEGKTVSDNTIQILQTYIAPIFPLNIGEFKIYIEENPISLSRLTASIVKKQFSCVSKLDGKKHIFGSSLIEGLKSIQFKNAEPRSVAIFATKTTKGPMQNLITTLNDPPDSMGGFRGMPNHFGIRLQPLPDSPYVVNNIEEYMEVARSLALSPDLQKNSALAFISLSEEDETYQQPVPLYYRLKALLARTGHASQMVDRDTLTNGYARWNLALNIAAKLGAIPWTLESKSSLHPVELFLGLSYSSIRTESLGQSRNIAYVNVFDGAGTWQVFCSDGSVFSFEERLKVFPRVASEAVLSATDKPASLRLVEVHYNKRFGFKERQAIAKGIREVAPDAAINFVSISDDHPLRFFDSKNNLLACPRGTVLQLGQGTAYVQTTAADKWSGLPRPLRIQIYRDFSSSPDNALDVSERILGLTQLNWKSVKDYSSLPVTILYSSAVAKFTNYFSLTDWKGIDHALKRTPWFL